MQNLVRKKENVIVGPAIERQKFHVGGIFYKKKSCRGDVWNFGRLMKGGGVTILDNREQLGVAKFQKKNVDVK